MRPENPFVSVVLPIRNEVNYIEECLARLLRQDYPADRYEILVVDGESTDGTRDKVTAMRERTGYDRLRLLDNPGRIVPSALNVGIREARGEIVVRMDGHTVPKDDYVSACVNALQFSGASNAGGPMVPVGESPFGKAVAVALQHPLGVGGAKFHYRGARGYVDTVYMGAFRKEIFARAGMFDESMVRNQDYEMNVRIRDAGGRVYLDSRIESTYTPRSTVADLWRQFFQYGWWRVETIRRHPNSLRFRQVVPASFVAALLALAAAAPFFSFAAIALAVLLVTYLSALGASAAGVWASNPTPHHLPVAARFPVALGVMHLSWGLGFLTSAVSGGTYPYRASRPRVPALGAADTATPAEVRSDEAAVPAVPNTRR